MENVIVFRNNPIAIIHQVGVNFDAKKELELLNQKYPSETFRVYFWIDDFSGSLDKEIKQKFSQLFEKYGLNENLYLGGKKFDISTLLEIKDEAFDIIPRQGQDGGVLGIINIP